MTDRITALRALEAAMVKGKSRATYIRDVAVEAGMSWGEASTLANAYDDLPTAAFAALRELLPEWRLIILQTATVWIATLIKSPEGGANASNHDPARAMSLAIVRALIWEAENG